MFPKGTLIETPDGIFNVLGVVTEEEYPGYFELDQEKKWYVPFCNRNQIERIFNPKNSEDILLKRQVDSVLDNMRINRVFYKRYNTSVKWDIEEQFDKTIFQLLKLILQGTDLYKKFEAIPCGITYDSDANGQCIKTEFGNIITISASLKDFLYFMNIFYYGISTNTVSHLVMYSAQCIALRIMLRTEALDFDLDPRGDVPDEIDEVVSSNTKWELLFVAAHEFAHNILGHLDDNNVIRCVTSNETIIIYNQSQKQEFEADIKAIEIIGSQLGIEEAVEMAAAFFMSLDLFEQAKEQIYPSMHSYKTHPSAVERIRNIYNYYKINGEKYEKFISMNNVIKNNLMEDISINFERYEFYGSIYLGEWHKKMLKDRIDY